MSEKLEHLNRCLICHAPVEEDQKLCSLCRGRDRDQMSPAKPVKLPKEAFSGECPACGARIDRERPLCPLCSKTIADRKDEKQNHHQKKVDE